MSKPILCLDFDGCIHDYRDGWKDGSIYGDVVPGFFDWARHAANYFRLVVYSSRSKTEEGRAEMAAWILLRQTEYEDCYGTLDIEFEFAHEKPPAFLTIDDRAVRFSGLWLEDPDLDPKKLRRFTTWSQPPHPDDIREAEERAAVGNMALFEEELRHLINKYSLENGSKTPDWVLAAHLVGCLKAFNDTMVAREAWYGRSIEENESVCEQTSPIGMVGKVARDIVSYIIRDPGPIGDKEDYK